MISQRMASTRWKAQHASGWDAPGGPFLASSGITGGSGGMALFEHHATGFETIPVTLLRGALLGLTAWAAALFGLAAFA